MKWVFKHQDLQMFNLKLKDWINMSNEFHILAKPDILKYLGEL